MVKIRLRRVGKKKQPSYRITVADSRAPRDGRFIEVIGFYNPRTEPETVQIKEERALHWLNVGAQPTLAVARLLEKQGTMARLARLRGGESLETLVAEAEAAAQAEPAVSAKTKSPPAARPRPAEEEVVVEAQPGPPLEAAAEPPAEMEPESPAEDLEEREEPVEE
jgi:small subunit ribosomal protein S16